MTNYNDINKPGREESKTGVKFWNRVWILCVVLVLAMSATAFYYRHEAYAIVHAFSTVHTIRHFIITQAPALRKDFPFLPEGRTEFTEERFKRYCQARDTIGAGMQPLLKDLSLLEELPKNGKYSDIARAGIKFEPLMSGIQTFTLSVEPALRESQMSVEEFRWMAIQSWGLTAQHMLEGNKKAILESQDEKDHFERLLGRSLQRAKPEEYASMILKELGEDFNVKNRVEAWSVMDNNWKIWAGSPHGPEVDVSIMHGWEKLQKQFIKNRK